MTPTIVTPVDDSTAARQLRQQAARLRDEAREGQRAAAALRRDAEQAARDADKRMQQAAAESGELDRQAALLERRVVLAEQADRLDLQVADAERELAKLVDEHGRLIAEVDTLDARLGDLRAKAEEAAAGIVFAQSNGDSAAVAEYRLRSRAIDEVRAEAAGRRETAAERLAAVGRGGDLRTWAERHVAELRGRRDKVLRELDPTLLDRRGDVHRHVERLAGADVEEQIASVAALLASGSNA